jgi:SAM-dependent methyltransferase
VAQYIDFSANAPIYDCRHGSALTPDFAQNLLEASGLEDNARVLDVGAGTGRVSVAFAQLGCDVLAVDPAIAMLKRLQSKSAGGRLGSIAAESCHLPFQDQSVDAVVLARILYLLADWRASLRAARDVLKAGGKLFHEWGNGDRNEPWVQVREKARALFQQAGISSPFHPGARSEAEVESCLIELGFIRKAHMEAGPGPSMTLRDFLSKIESGELSFVWNVPRSVQDSCLPLLRLWCEQTFELDRLRPMPEVDRWVIYAKAPLDSSE